MSLKSTLLAFKKSCKSCPNLGEGGWDGGYLDKIQKNSIIFFGMSFLSLTKSYFKRRGVASSCHPRPNHPNWPNIYRGDTVRICLLLVYYFCHWVKWVHQDCGVPSLWGNILYTPIIFCEWIDFLNSHWKLWYLAHGHVSLFESEFLFLNLLWH